MTNEKFYLVQLFSIDLIEGFAQDKFVNKQKAFAAAKEYSSKYKNSTIRIFECVDLSTELSNALYGTGKSNADSPKRIS